MIKKEAKDERLRVPELEACFFHLLPFALRLLYYNRQLDISFECFRRPTNSSYIATGFGIIGDYSHLTGSNMGNPVEREQLKSDLILPWVIVGIMLSMLAAYIIVCHTLGERLQQPLPEAQRMMLRTAFYAIAIVTFPLTNLLRHIQLRLNQTMPCSQSPHELVAKRRYLVTVIVSMSLVEVVGVFGLAMFVLGDDFNTLYIFTGLSALGLFLYRPKVDEYSAIIAAIAAQKHD
jgi:hypothetical protein